MARRTLQSMTDAELLDERRVMSATPGKYASKRFQAILAEQSKREDQ